MQTNPEEFRYTGISSPTCNYYIGNKGTVFSVSICSHTIKQLKKYFDKKGKIGYFVVNINGKPTYIHRLVAKAFIEIPENMYMVNHLDGDTTNNSANNLEWTNHAGNRRHAIETGLVSRIMPQKTRDKISKTVKKSWKGRKNARKI